MCADPDMVCFPVNLKNQEIFTGNVGQKEFSLAPIEFYLIFLITRVGILIRQIFNLFWGSKKCLVYVISR